MPTTVDTVAQQAQDAYTDVQRIADEALAEARQAIVSAEQAVEGIIGVRYQPTGNPVDVIPGDIVEPVIPTTDFYTDVKTAFDYALGTFNQSIQPQLVNYLDTFFPDISGAVKTGSDQWIVDTIENGRFVPVDVENAIWNRAKDREIKESLRTEQSIIDVGATRGFAIPPGSLADAVRANQQETSMKLSTINREITMKVFDTANENSKFAIEQAVSLRTSFVSALGDFLKVATEQPNNATDYAKLVLESKTSLYDSAVRLYSAQIGEEDMRTGVLLANRGQDIQTHQNSSHDFDTHVAASENKAKIRADAALKAAEQLGIIAAGALATRNTMVSLAAGV